MIATFDTETAGLFGHIRLMGFYHDGMYQVTTKPGEWWTYAKSAVIDGDNSPVWYAHNLDFDLGKLYNAVPEMRQTIAWNKCIQIHFRMVRVEFKSGVVLQDSMALLPGSLDEVLRSWGTEIGKMSSEELALKGGYKDKDDYFSRVPIDDANYREYLRHDVMGLYEVIHKLYEFTGLSEQQFCKRLTTASLAMKLYQSWYPESYEELTSTRWKGSTDKAFRRAYYGGRTEVFETHVEDGYHYDVNSLYPFVMGANEYPTGYPETATGERAAELWRWFNPDVYGNSIYEACIVTAVVSVPKSLSIPPLPVRYKGRLIFPVGRIKGTWCGCELANAVRHGCKVLEVIDIAAWRHTAPYFVGWVERMSERKCNAKGAERTFYKLLQNALYGKFAQRPEQTSVSEHTPELERKCRDHNRPYLVRVTDVGLLMDYEIKRYAKHMQPHIAAHITAYARMVLYNAIRAEQGRGNRVVYCDTDSLVTTRPMKPFCVDPKLYGRWKLEREVGQGLYVSPKLYAEVEGEHIVLKGKGLVREYRETLCFDSYQSIMNRLEDGETLIELYKGIPNRRRFLRAILAGKDPDEPRYESKSIHADNWQKRCIDWREGTTRPWTLRELAEITRKEPCEGIESLEAICEVKPWPSGTRSMRYTEQ